MVASFVIGLDLAPAAEPTGLAVVERITVEGVPGCAVRHLQRFVPGTPFSTIGRAVGDMVKSGTIGCPPVVCDLTAVGPTLVPELRKAGVGWVVPAVLTAGLDAVEENHVWKLPKKDVVTRLQVLFQEHRLKIGRELPEAEELVKELQAFRAKASLDPADAAADWRARPGEDLVLAVGLACWWAGRHSGVTEIHLPNPDQRRNFTLPDDLFPPMPKDLFR